MDLVTSCIDYEFLSCCHGMANWKLEGSFLGGGGGGGGGGSLIPLFLEVHGVGLWV